MLADMPKPFPKVHLQKAVCSNLESSIDLTEQMQERIVTLQQALKVELTLHRISETIQYSLDEAHVLKTAVQELALELEADCYAVLLMDTEEQIFASNFPFQNTVSGDQPNIISDPQIVQQLQTENFLQFCFNTNFAQERLTLFTCPITTDGENLGNLWVIREASKMLAETEIYLVQQVAKQCAIAIHQSRLYQGVQKQVEELKRLSEAKDDLLNRVTHDLRSPLSNMRLAICMLEYQLTAARSQCGQFSQQNSACSKTLTHLKILQTECEREITLVNDLLDLKRLESDDQALNLSDEIDLRDWLTSLIQRFEKRIQERQLTLEVNIAPNLPTLISDSASLHRVLSELLHNACKYTPPHETISLNVLSNSGHIQIKVSNSGVEIPPEEQSRIFDKFYRIPSSDRWKQGGTGLGLALVKETIAHLGGSIHLERRSGQTCFAIQLLLK